MQKDNKHLLVVEVEVDKVEIDEIRTLLCFETQWLHRLQQNARQVNSY